jgi:hypothetical protein
MSSEKDGRIIGCTTVAVTVTGDVSPVTLWILLLENPNPSAGLRGLGYFSEVSVPCFPDTAALKMVVTHDPCPGVRRKAEIVMPGLESLPEALELSRTFSRTVVGGGVVVIFDGHGAVMTHYEPYPPDHPKFTDFKVCLTGNVNSSDC